jgi:hypothetical protein
MKLLPTEKLALKVLGWGLLIVLSFFFHVVGFVTVILMAAYQMQMFMFVYANTKGFPYDSERSDGTTEAKSDYEQPTIPGL